MSGNHVAPSAPAPPATIVASQPLLSEEELFNCRLGMPNLKIGTVSFQTKKAESVPFDPESIEVVPFASFLNMAKYGRHGHFTGNNDKVENTMPPVDWRNNLFSENDNRADLRDKVYLPLSRVLAPRNIAFSQDSDFVHTEGTADTVIASKDSSLVQVVLEEKSESLFQKLLPAASSSFPRICIQGRNEFLRGVGTPTQNTLFQCPLILAQLLGYMFASKVCRGIITSSGRAYFVWIDPVKTVRNDRRARKKAKVSRKIYITEKMPIDHPHFLRAMASFVVKSFEMDRNEAINAAQLLGVSSADGGFCRGGEQKHSTMDRPGEGSSTAVASAQQPSSSGGKGSSRGKGKQKKESGRCVALEIPKLPKVPNPRQRSIVASTLGRDRRGNVFETKWHGVPAAVKMVYTDGEDGKYVRDLFYSELKAYRLAGSAGLWGKAVPGPLFWVDAASMCAIGMAKGMPMPLDPLEWSDEDLQQGREAVLLLHHSGVTLTDIKPANFVKLADKVTKGNREETAERVVAIDLECFWENENSIEVPPWLWKQDSTVSVQSGGNTAAVDFTESYSP